MGQAEHLASYALRKGIWLGCFPLTGNTEIQMSTHICMFVRYILKSLAPFPRKDTMLTLYAYTAYDVDHCCYQSSNLFPFRLLKSLGKFQALNDSQELNILSKNAFIFNRAWFCIDLAVRF